MTVHDFIFTKDVPKRYYRHIAFWVTRFILQILSVSHNFNVCFWECLFKEARAGLYAIVPEIIFTYAIVYYAIPRFFDRKKYFKFSAFALILGIACYISFSFFPLKMHNIFYESLDNQIITLWHYTMTFITQGPPVACILFLAIKMFKTNYQKLEEKQLLAKENQDAELQLLKAQVHPHFLFNTLNNIYSFTLSKSEQAGVLVQKLTSVFRYMTNECDQPLVSVEKELKILRDYIALEKVRYGNRISIDIKIKGDPTNKMITPLLMIPFVENSFKHGTSQMLSESWINLEIRIANNILNFNLQNSKPPQNNYSKGKNGIGIENVKKRLELIYASEHTLTIGSNDNIFSVNMAVPLHEMENQSLVPGKANGPGILQKSIPAV